MAKKTLTQKVLLGLMGATFVGSSLLISVPAGYAAPATQVETMQEEGAGNFSARIQAILQDYNQESHYRSAESYDARPRDDASRQVVQESPPQYVEASYDAYEPRYNFDWQGTPLASSLYGIAKIANKNIVINGNLDGTVYMSLRNATYTEALQKISNAFDLNWVVQGETVVISTGDLMKQSKTFRVRNIFDMETLKEEFKGIGIEDDAIYPNAEQRTVSVTGTTYQLEQAERRLRTIDKPISQCLVVAQLIEVSHGKNLDLGFSYTLPSYTHTGGDGNGSELHGNWISKLTFGVTSTANRSLNNGKVIARPMVMMMNGQEGRVNFGDRVPIMTTTATTGATTVNTEYMDVGTLLTITPTINEDTNTVTMKVETKVSNITGYQTIGQNKAPQISTREATTSAHLRSGESFVIGGLMTKNEMKSLSGIPGLMNLPILGELFKFRSNSHSYGEVYIMLTPYIVTDNIDPQALIQKTYSDKTKSETEREAQKNVKGRR